MAAPGKVPPTALVGPGILGSMTATQAAAQAKAAGVPPEISDTWTGYLTAIGRTVPFNVNRARAAVARFADAVR